VDPSDIRHVSERRALELLRRIWEDPWQRRHLVEQLREVMWAPRTATDDEVLERAITWSSTRWGIAYIREAPRNLDEPDYIDLRDFLDEPRDDPPSRPTWISIELVGPSGERYPRARLKVRLCGGAARDCRVERDSTWRADDVPDKGTCYFDLLETCEADSPAAKVKPPADAVRIEPLGTSVSLVTQRHHVLVVMTKATVMTVPSYRVGAALFGPGDLEFDEETNQAVTGIGCIAQILAFMRRYPERTVLVVGHTDASGKNEDNDRLAQRRAKAILSLLRGDEEAWVTSCAGAKVEDFEEILRWTARRLGWPTDPGNAPTDGERSQATESYRERAREELGIDVQGSTDAPQRDDWRVAFAMFQRVWADELGVELEALQSLQSEIKFCEPNVLAVGERWPRHTADGTTEDVPRNRRVEVLFFARPESVPSLAEDGSNLYGDEPEVWLEYVDPAPRVHLPVRLVSEAGHPIPDVRVEFASDTGAERRAILDEEGFALLYDVPAGPFSLDYPDHEEIEAKAWAVDARAALLASDLDSLYDVVVQPIPVLKAAAGAYADLYGSEFAEDLRSATSDPGYAQDFAVRLFEAELDSQERFALASVNANQGRHQRGKESQDRFARRPLLPEDEQGEAGGGVIV